MKKIILVCVVWILSGCATQFSTLRAEGSASQTIYAIPEEQAFQIAFSALTTILPGYEVTDIDGPVKGYSAMFRFVLDTYTQQVMVVPATGIDKDGKNVRGYYFDVSGRGSSVVQGRAKNVELFELVSTSAKATGKAVSVTDVKTVPYIGVHWKQGEIGRQQMQSANTAKEEVFNQIERLKQMHDRGIISDADFERKKKELLDRI